MKTQTKSNAKRSAASATARTGFEHTIAQQGEGWIVILAPQEQDATTQKPDAAPQEDAGADAMVEQEIAEAEAGHAAWESAAAPAEDLVQMEQWAGGEYDAREDAPAAEEAPASAKASLRDAALAILAAWDDDDAHMDIHAALEQPIANLRAALATRPAKTAEPKGPRENTKQEQVLMMLRSDAGASTPEIAEATGWNNNTVRGFLSGLRKKGMVLEAAKDATHEGRPVTSYRITTSQ